MLNADHPEHVRETSLAIWTQASSKVVAGRTCHTLSGRTNGKRVVPG